MKNFCIDLEEHATKIINYETKSDTNNYTNHIYHIVSKTFVIYVKKDLVLMMTIKNTLT